MKHHCDILSACSLPEECPPGYSLERLTGDASTRSYFRIGLQDEKTMMLMKMPEPFDPENFPYLYNYHLFRSLGVDLAEIYGMEPGRGYVFLQDLGDATFYELDSQWPDQIRLAYYLKAIDSLQRIKSGAPHRGLSFDREKFLW